MGKSLMIKRNGVHMAFAGGTGVLVFLDLVSQLALNNLKIVPDLFGSDFEFHLYVSFPNEEQSIGLELCKMLTEVNKKLQNKNFKLVVRISEKGAKRGKRGSLWDEDYIVKHVQSVIVNNNKRIERIWVCGSP